MNTSPPGKADVGNVQLQPGGRLGRSDLCGPTTQTHRPGPRDTDTLPCDLSHRETVTLPPPPPQPTVGIAIIRASYAAKALLPCRVPNLQEKHTSPPTSPSAREAYITVYVITRITELVFGHLSPETLASQLLKSMPPCTVTNHYNTNCGATARTIK